MKHMGQAYFNQWTFHYNPSPINSKLSIIPKLSNFNCHQIRVSNSSNSKSKKSTMVKITIGSENEVNANNSNRNSMNNKQIMKKNMQRIGGRGLSLNAFANAKTFNKDYNPSIIKKKKEFYRNAKFIKKYKKSVKQQEHPLDNVGTSMNQHEKQNNLAMEESGNEAGNAYKFNKKTKGREKNSAFSLKEVYRKKCEEEEKARMEREALIQAKKEGKQKAEVRRKDLREKMFKKTRKGQPVMKYRIEHLLETIQQSSN